MSKRHSKSPYNEGHQNKAVHLKNGLRVARNDYLKSERSQPVPDIRITNGFAYEAGQRTLSRCVCKRTDIPPLANGTRMQHTRKQIDRFGRKVRVHCPGSGTKLSVWDGLDRNARWDRAFGTGKSLGAELGI